MTQQMTIARETIRRFMEESIPFNRLLGIRLGDLGFGFARLELPFADHLVGDPYRPALHGGVGATLLDSCGGAAVFSTLNEGDMISTVDMRVDYLNPAPLETLICEARVIRRGNRVAVTEMKCFSKDQPDRVISVGKAVYNIRRKQLSRETAGKNRKNSTEAPD